jgi:hypothetical protein
MVTRKKVLLALCLGIVLVVLIIGGAMLYVITHPQTVKPLVENSLATATGAKCSIQALDLTVNPLSLIVKGFALVSDTPQAQYHFGFPLLQAQMVLEGSFGSRTLVIQDLHLQDANFSIAAPEVGLPDIAFKSEKPSALGRLAGQLLKLLVFRDIRWQTAVIDNAQAEARFGEDHYQADTITVTAEAGQATHIAGKVTIDLPTLGMQVVVPSLDITGESLLNISDSPMAFAVSAQNIEFHHPSAQVDTVTLKARCRYAAREQRLRFEALDVTADEVRLVQGTALTQGLGVDTAVGRHAHLATKLDYAVTTGVIGIGGLTAEVKEFAVTRRPSQKLPVIGLRLSANGKADLSQSTFAINAVDVSLNDIAALKGRIQGTFGSQSVLKILIDSARVVPGQLRQFLPAKINRTLEPFELQDQIVLQGMAEGARDTAMKWTWQGDMEAGLDRNPFGYTVKNVNLRGRLGGTVNVSGKLPNLAVSAELRSDDTQLLGNAIDVAPFTVRLAVQGTYPEFEIQDMVVVVPQVKLNARRGAMRFNQVRLRMDQGRVNAAHKTVGLFDIMIDSDELRNLRALMTLKDRQTTVEIDGQDVHLLQSLIGWGVLPLDGQLASNDGLRFKAVSDDGRLWRLNAEAQFQNIVFENAAGSMLGEAVTVGITTQGNISLDRGQTNVQLKVNAERGEILIDRFYLNLDQNSIAHSGSLRYNTPQNTLWLDANRFSIRDILAVTIGGSINLSPLARQIDLRLDFPKTALPPAFKHMVVEPFASEHPLLAELQPLGNISAKGHFKLGNTGWQLKGRCSWRDGEIRSEKNNIALTGITLDMPFWFHTMPDTPSADRLNGALEVQTLRIPGLPPQGIALPLQAGPNRMSVEVPTPIQVPGGQVRVGTIKAIDLLTSQRTITTRISMDEIELQPLLSKAWGRKIKGQLRGSLNPVIYRNQELETHGELLATVFGGQIRFSEMGAKGLMTGAPVWRFSTQWEDLLLADMTQDTAFGKIEGVLYGYANDIQIAYGEPQKFDMLMETKPQKGIRQKISVLAVDNIAKLGGGQSPFIGLAGVVTTFLKEFPYSKIGVRAALQNDTFTVNGTIQQDGTEYLVKRGGLAGVDVINQNPDNRVSFKDMVKRIKRIKSRKGPVIQ